MEKYIFDEQLRTFSISLDTDLVKKLALTIGATAAIATVRAVTKAYKKRNIQIQRDAVKNRRDRSLVELMRKYEEDPSIKSKEGDSRKYKETLHLLLKDTIATLRLEGEITVDDSFYDQAVVPLIALLRMVLIPEVHVLPGSTLERRYNFELVLDPDKKRPEDVAKDPFRYAIYKYPWPHHEFKINTKDSKELNLLIDSVFEFISNNPKYLSIRI